MSNTTEQIPQYVEPAPKRRKWPGRLATGIGLVVAFGAGIGIGAAGSTTKTVAVTKTVTVPSASPSPVVQTVTVSPPPPAAQTTVLKYTSTGNQATPRFTIGGSGDYTIYWSYSGNLDPQLGQPSNFAITEDGGNDSNSSFGLPNDIKASGSGSTGVSNDAGTHYFNVQAVGTWTIQVVTAP